LDLLYANTTCTSMPRREWEAEVCLATAISRSLPFLQGNAGQPVGAIIDRRSRSDLCGQLTSAPATLAVSCHNGFPTLRLKLFEFLFADGVAISTYGNYRARNGGYSLFAAREALLKGRPVLMTPDGPFGRRTGTLSVLGAQRPVADGAPFLAHSTHCNVVWYEIVRTETGFDVETVPGPRASPDEPFADYRQRFFEFYNRQVVASFTTHPRNLVVLPGWVRTFTAMLEKQQLSQPNSAAST
jgi:hypothetical protein